MKNNFVLINDLEKYKDCVILVEGKKDVVALNNLGFEKVYALHKNKKAIRERVEEIVEEIGNLKKIEFCILTDLDEVGRKIYLQVKSILQELGVKVDSRLRRLLIQTGVSHVEGLGRFVERAEESDFRVSKILKTE